MYMCLAGAFVLMFQWLFVAGLPWFVVMNCQMEWKVHLFEGNNLKRKL